jgi:type II restriction/modification system DNA methylase subunit YeeA
MDNGYEWTEPILAPLETIQLQDALVTETAGHASETLWPKADYIIGNPPFLGRQMQRRRLGDAYIETLRLTYRARLSRGCDLVCYFFEQARSQIENGCAKRVGLLANTTISQIDNREVLQRIKATGDIFMAWTNVPWILDGASVRIAIVGFDDGAESSKQLDGFTVESIGADLTKVGGDTPVHRLHENLAISFQGPIKVGPFDISGDVARSWLTAPLNPHGKPNSDVVKRYVNASEITRRPQDKWIVDFGTNITQGEASLYEQPFEHVLKHVKPVRERQNHSGRREYWWIHGSPAGQMRVAISQIDRVIVTPRVAKHRMFVWLAAEAYPDNRLNVFARDDDYFFGVLHSRAHEVWSLHMASRHGLGNDPTYNNTTCFETFPLPWPPGAEPVDDPRVVAIGEAAARLDELRRNWLDPEGATEAELKKRTLTNLYNQLPTWLQHANAELDRAVWAAYGWDDLIPAEVDEAAILSRLLALNLERSG